uniref:Small-subunit processome Utp12 domain-containing protein n=1 Tax=Aureoumbra lagunensis TaxID=44058 RepID=A0A7S3NKK6_9STRA|mmetsp:Transcript_20838/g.31917  ORF Transcript_20838/g.31917 Transcript_20838/m.31917 type:complete len:868 (+) Transcript_20838:96-2699(+)|eukprot:CAMPEP_0197318228 /NCGR_PEP_ID=MMETSP0891-20130614/50059_1 /TAXON_ID=44058 ORGANISM="Aureoumbra lagunensis, Strain CCMP1510" /NCGR_SAMPLE_ID=MMETSP0891 /ASSEMBLY_ACC=CAM_ASM_000534 /LENGTH=867 /DNA_ID=CAMNT_0042808567 /DNA_START=74 /DNA_END=2677 /DNA_ORIENTATION=-
MEFICRRVAGAVHSGGNLIFAQNDERLYSAIGRRVSYVDLKQQATNAVGGNFEAKAEIDRLALSSDGVLLVAIDIEGHLTAINVERSVVLYRFALKGRCLAAEFSHDDGYLAVTQGRFTGLWLAPARRRRELLPFTKTSTLGGAIGQAVSLAWSPTSKYLAVGSADATIRIYTIEIYNQDEGDTKTKAFRLAAHKETVNQIFWLPDRQDIFLLSCAADAVAASWVWSQGDHDWSSRKKLWALEAKHFLWNETSGTNYSVKLQSAAISGSVLVCAFSSGVFAVYDATSPKALPCLHKLSAARGSIDTVAMSGDLIALGSKRFGQLAVWHWRDEAFALKQQGHDHEATCAAWSPDGRVFASGGADHKVKVWSDATGFCFATFDDHLAPVAAVAFAASKNAFLASASADGTVRLYDLARYRCFRILQAPSYIRTAKATAPTGNASAQLKAMHTKMNKDHDTPGAPLSSLALDPDGEIVCAGSREPFEIYVWATRTGKLLDTLAGHEGPISCLAFDPRDPSTLASGSWDNTVRLWRVYRNEQIDEPLTHPAHVLALAYRPDGHRLCIACADAAIHVWDQAEARLIAVIDAKPDLGIGGKFFDALAYSVDGKRILAGGISRFVCLYAVEQKVLLAKFAVTGRSSSDNIDEKERATAEDDQDDADELPGAKRFKLAGQALRATEANVNAVAFSPTGRSFVAVIPSAILVFGIPEESRFAPFEVDESVTPLAVADALKASEPAKALAMALQLADDNLTDAVLKHACIDDIALLVAGIPAKRAAPLVTLISDRIERSPHLEFYLEWLLALLRTHAEHLREDPAAVRTAQRALLGAQRTLTPLLEDNTFAFSYLGSVAASSNNGRSNTTTTAVVKN